MKRSIPDAAITVSFYQEDLSTDIVGEVQQFQNYIHSKYQGKKTDFTHDFTFSAL